MSSLTITSSLGQGNELPSKFGLVGCSILIDSGLNQECETRVVVACSDNLTSTMQLQLQALKSFIALALRVKDDYWIDGWIRDKIN